MDGLFFLLLILWLFKKFGSKKKQTSKNPPFKQKKPDFLDQVVKAATEDEPIFKGIVQALSPKEPQKIDPHHAPMAEGESHMVQTSFLSGEGSEYMGSLHETSTEGIDLCDPMLSHDEPTLEVAQESVYTGEIGRDPVIDLSPRGLYQGVVMSEILTRPALRRKCHG